MKEGLINFKGIKEGIYIHIKEGDFEVIKGNLKKKLNEYIDLFKGTDFLGIKGEGLTEEEVGELLNIIKDNYNLEPSKEVPPYYFEEEEMPFSGIDEGVTKFINNTIRSGQVIEYDGNIVIIGDVNPGALIKAKGNIIILGIMRGVAHAGVGGNSDAIIAAYDLQPTQLRIGNIIGRKPDEDVPSSGVPEVARVNNGEVIIEPYLLKNNKRRKEKWEEQL
ncbi:septum site-determining protein MinC [Tepidimicrobium xylanilyticum]|uniref:Probable septum site-determining protein MinC n=1 Tax=Tepidimicrobium xylanilyticum TaxID=1123352 RepID=A0A1H3BW79_9FIRM|nr:septum site-determining protein MinC [Tepidimicrobium xylanilyticum]SDX45439.1 septum site-determining protein MinC [Tepidimicrobium xylanilyticum]